jgi:hypothetical protein
MSNVFVMGIRTAKGSWIEAGVAVLCRRLLLTSVAVFALALQVVAAPNNGGDICAPAAGTIVRAGDVVEVSWTPVPADVEEFELLLSLDGGRTFPLRLTAMLDPGLTSYSWRVPNLPAGAACLRLRVGVDEREEMLRPGPLFQVVGDDGAPGGRITFQSGEWWPTEGIAAEPHDVEVEPWWSDQEPRGDGSVATAAFPPQRPDVGALQTATSVGDSNAFSRRPRPAVLLREDRAATSFPKRE